MSSIGAIQGITPGEAWQALLQAMHEAEPAAAQPPDSPTEAAAPAASAAAQAGQAAQGLPAAAAADAPLAVSLHAEAAAAVLPMAPVLMQPLSLQGGPELRWRVQDRPAWQQLFDDAGQETPDPAEPDDDDAPPPHVPDDAAGQDLPPPAWAQALLARLREAATTPGAAAALRPALQAWRLGLPVLLASPAGLASLQASGDAAVWRWRRWPARWRSARPATAERWWAVRLGLTAQGRLRTLRELAGERRPAPGQVSCELRLDDAAPGLAQWTEVLVQAPGQPSLQALLAARPSLTWLLCNRPLWPQEGP